mgnify:CR=1 FL=1
MVRLSRRLRHLRKTRKLSRKRRMIRRTRIRILMTNQTRTDSEVLLHGYEEYGEKLLNMLRGMFSFVIWNKNTKELFGARDFFGIKPMYYAVMNGTFMFGSEIKTFLAHPHFQKELNTDVLEQYLTFQYSPTEDTFFKGVKKLPPAHYFLYENGRLTTAYKKEWAKSFGDRYLKQLARSQAMFDPDKEWDLLSKGEIANTGQFKELADVDYREELGILRAELEEELRQDDTD